MQRVGGCWQDRESWVCTEAESPGNRMGGGALQGGCNRTKNMSRDTGMKELGDPRHRSRVHSLFF